MKRPRPEHFYAQLAEAIRRAKARAQPVNPIPVGKGLNQSGPPPETNATSNAWPTEGDYAA